MTFPWVLRAYTRSDEAFVFATWINSYRDGSAAGTLCSNQSFSRGHHAALEKLFNRPSVRIVVACDVKDNEQIYGYTCYEPQDSRVVLHYVFVKRHPVDYRHNGLGRALVTLSMTPPEPDGRVLKPVVCSHMTVLADAMVYNERHKAERKAYKFAHSPYLLFDPDAEVWFKEP